MQRQMKRVIAGAFAVWLVGWAGGFGTAIAASEPAYPWAPGPPPSPSPVGDASTAKVVYALGGARMPGIPWYEYTNQAGSQYFPNAKHDLIDYPAGAAFSWWPTMLLPPGSHQDNMTVGVAVKDGTNSLDNAIHHGTDPAAAVGLSQGSLVLDQEQARLANDPTAPAPDKLQFTTFGDPTGRHAFGASFLARIFPPGSHIPIPFIEYTMPQQVDSQYDTNHVVTAYDGFSEFPDRPDNLLAVANAAIGAAIAHTPIGFTGPGDVPPQNIRTTVNSRGATTTTYLVPVNHLPLTLPLRYLGMSDAEVDQIDSVLQPQIDAAYARNDNWFTRPVSVDPVRGLDPLTAPGSIVEGARGLLGSPAFGG